MSVGTAASRVQSCWQHLRDEGLLIDPEDLQVVYSPSSRLGQAYTQFQAWGRVADRTWELILCLIVLACVYFYM